MESWDMRGIQGYIKIDHEDLWSIMCSAWECALCSYCLANYVWISIAKGISWPTLFNRNQLWCFLNSCFEPISVMKNHVQSVLHVMDHENTIIIKYQRAKNSEIDGRSGSFRKFWWETLSTEYHLCSKVQNQYRAWSFIKNQQDLWLFTIILLISIDLTGWSWTIMINHERSCVLHWNLLHFIFVLQNKFWIWLANEISETLILNHNLLRSSMQVFRGPVLVVKNHVFSALVMFLMEDQGHTSSMMNRQRRSRSHVHPSYRELSSMQNQHDVCRFTVKFSALN